MINAKEFKSKLLISTIKSLIPNIEKTFYLNIIVNEDKTFKTKALDLKKSNIIDLNQIFELEGINSIDTIKFQIYEKSTIFSNALFKGEVNKSNQIKDEFSNQSICFLSNNNQENCVVVYYNYEINPDLLATFDQNLKLLEEEQKSKIGQKSYFGNLKDLASRDNAENFSRFVHNMEYIRTLKNTVDEVINWKSYWKTISLLFICTYGIIYWKILFILSPIILIYFHLYNKDKMNNFSHKKTKHDNLSNMTLITKTIDITNKVIDSYENFLEAIQYSDKKIYEEIYVNLLKLILINILTVYFNLFNFKLFFLIAIWSFILLKNPSFHAFVIFLVNFINKKFISQIDRSTKVSNFVQHTKIVFFIVIPFANIFRKIYKIKKEIMICPQKKNSNQGSDIKLKDMFEKYNNKTVIMSNDIAGSNYTSVSNSDSKEFMKYEIYENERWWMFVGWAKNLILNERPIWSDISGKVPMEKNTVFLPNNEKYEWASDWKVEYGKDCDDQGWEYSSDFNSNYGVKSLGKVVRRRKWIRYAKKN